MTLFKFATDIQNGYKKLKGEKLIEVFVNGILIENTSEYQIELNRQIKITLESYSDKGIYHGGKNNKQHLFKIDNYW